MKVNVIERSDRDTRSKAVQAKYPRELIPFNATVTDKNLVIDPTYDMDVIEYWEDKFIKRNIGYAIVECRKVTKKKNEFLGWSIVADSIYNKDKENSENLH